MEFAAGPSVGENALSWAKEMFSFPRSLTGDGVRQTLEYLQVLNPGLKITGVPSGENVFDWEVPQEWKVSEAYIQHIASGQKYAQFSESNLNLVGYSEPIDAVMSLEDLRPRIHTQLDQPDWVPYVTSYYKRSWGFCMSENQKRALPEGDYRVVIHSELFDGEMLFADLVIPGERDEEILFSTNICHPSMANNELSGPVLMSALAQFLKQEFTTRRYTYRFVFVPETIGALTYLLNHLAHLKQKVVCGFTLSCVGDEREYSHVESRLGNSLPDKALDAAFIGLPNTKRYSFLERGSDERQYCAPGIDLPVAGYCRSKYGEFPEYHTNADNFEVVTEDGLQGSFDVMAIIIKAFESGLYPKTTVLGEPQLGRYGLYPTTSKAGSYEHVLTRMNVLAYADGQHSVFDIAKAVAKPLADVLSEIQLLGDRGLIRLED